MAVKMVPVVCPQCKAALKFEEGLREGYCQYCGTKIIIVNENEYVYKIVDEAEIAKAQAEKEVELEKIRSKERRAALSKRKEIMELMVPLSIVLAYIIFAIILAITGKL